MIILGIDPGSRKTGFGCIEKSGKSLKLLGQGVIQLNAKNSMDQRLLELSMGLEKLIKEYGPSILAIEKAFVKNNIQSALRLGETRGAIMVSGARHSLSVVEYSPAEVKKSVAGNGRADKEQLAKMVRLLCGARDLEFETLDASDAISIAVCHALSSGRSPLSAPRRGGKLSRALGLS